MTPSDSAATESLIATGGPHREVGFAGRQTDRAARGGRGYFQSLLSQRLIQLLVQRHRRRVCVLRLLQASGGQLDDPGPRVGRV
jgi:hypothetical protein